ncbi:hypothetical protein FOA43_001097 [Brettanomyces nanus]|uniref:Uncharacterized protein n=1 Tax=Eeniella nana TaxID=13502 RepID=A0A875RYR7_EENNA|nr:uncharacterized protein FOA43_001097 [Brettanomyces nanus]QPG73783.1 hypothetical protein FOA43_001097 [Brettanomyces nanus]
MYKPFKKNVDDQVTFEDVEYDPTIDPSNMSQYKPKNYRVEPIYEKKAVDDNVVAGTLPSYEELYEVTNEKSLTESDDSTESHNSKWKLLFKILLVWILVSELVHVPFCGHHTKTGQEITDTDDQHPYNMGNIVYKHRGCHTENVKQE